MPVAGMNEARGDGDERKNGDDLDQHHDVVGLGGLANAAYENDRENHHDDEGRPVEAEMPAGTVNHVTGKIAQSTGQIGGRYPARIGVHAEPVEQVDEVRRKAHADGHVADGVFEDEVPADNPGDDLAHGGVGVGIRAAGNGNHGGQFGVTNRSEPAGNCYEDEGKRDGGAGARAAERFRMADEVLEQGNIEDRRG